MEIDEALAVLKTYLRALHMTTKYSVDEYGDPQSPDGEYVTDPSPAGDLAREWARELLTEADANGLHGCRLCRS